MKIKEFELGQEVFINGYKYAYMGVNKVRFSGYSTQMIVFENREFGFKKNFELSIGNKELKEINGNFELK